MSCDIRQIPEIRDWIRIVKEGEYATCKDQKLLVDRVVLPAFEEEDIRVDTEQLAKYMHLCETYIPFELFPWQKFVIALHDCTYKADGTPRWPDLFCMLGRGAGKDGTIAVESFCLTSPYNGIREYDVDICANNEEQAVRPVQDLTGFFEAPKNLRKIKKFYGWTKEKITCTKTGSIIKGRIRQKARTASAPESWSLMRSTSTRTTTTSTYSPQDWARSSTRGAPTTRPMER